MAIQVTDGNFEQEVLKSPVPVLVDFWAPWCGPCRAMGPIIDELAVEFEGKVKICKMNVDENSASPSRFGIRAIPTLILFKDGRRGCGPVHWSRLQEQHQGHDRQKGIVTQ